MIVRVLLAEGVHIKGADDIRITPLTSAASQGHVEVAKVLLENGADIHEVDGGGHSPPNPDIGGLRGLHRGGQAPPEGRPEELS